MIRAAHVVAPAVLALLATSGSALAAQERGDSELRGTVVSAQGDEVVSGVWIGLQGADWGTFSWNDGHFYLPEVPAGPRRYEIRALGFEPELLTLEPSDAGLVVALTPDPEVLDGLDSFLEQLGTRRNRGGSLQVFDRQALAFHAYFDLRDFLAQHGVRRIRGVCLNERPEAVGILERDGHELYLVESVGGYVRIYTEDFVEQAARERLELQREPFICSGPVGTNTD